MEERSSKLVAGWRRLAQASRLIHLMLISPKLTKLNYLARLSPFAVSVAVRQPAPGADSRRAMAASDRGSGQGSGRASGSVCCAPLVCVPCVQPGAMPAAGAYGGCFPLTRRVRPSDCPGAARVALVNPAPPAAPAAPAAPATPAVLGASSGGAHPNGPIAEGGPAVDLEAQETDRHLAEVHPDSFNGSMNHALTIGYYFSMIHPESGR